MDKTDEIKFDFDATIKGGERQNNWLNKGLKVIEILLLVALIGLVLYAQIQGKYMSDTYYIDCAEANNKATENLGKHGEYGLFNADLIKLRESPNASKSR